MTAPRAARSAPHIRLVAERPDPAPEPALAVERLALIGSELAPLFLKFWEESGRLEPFDPDWTTVLRMEALGQLFVLAVRDAGALVGFVFNVQQKRNLFYDLPNATTLAYWLDPTLRLGWFPVKLFRHNLELLKQAGAKRVYVAAIDDRHGKIFERLGYTPIERHYSMGL